jgi:hypothetical protein
MRRFNRFGLIAVLAVAAAAAPAFAGNVTVGRFYTEIAKAKHMPAVDAASAEASLRGAGYRLPQLQLSKELTESDVTAISKSLGLSVTTTRPGAPVSDTQMSRFMASFGQEIGSVVIGPGEDTPQSPNSQGGDPGQSGNGKGKKKGHNKSVSEPI